MDNAVANCPKHYYASGDSTKLEPGTYKIAVANFAKAAGRTATVQATFNNDGVLGTKSVTLGRETGDALSQTLSNVEVDKNQQMGKFSVSLGQ